MIEMQETNISGDFKSCERELYIYRVYNNNK